MKPQRQYLYIAAGATVGAVTGLLLPGMDITAGIATGVAVGLAAGSGADACGRKLHWPTASRSARQKSGIRDRNDGQSRNHG